MGWGDYRREEKGMRWWWWWWYYYDWWFMRQETIDDWWLFMRRSGGYLQAEGILRYFRDTCWRTDAMALRAPRYSSSIARYLALRAIPGIFWDVLDKGTFAQMRPRHFSQIRTCCIVVCPMVVHVRLETIGVCSGSGVGCLLHRFLLVHVRLKKRIESIWWLLFWFGCGVRVQNV